MSSQTDQNASKRFATGEQRRSIRFRKTGFAIIVAFVLALIGSSTSFNTVPTTPQAAPSPIAMVTPAKPVVQASAPQIATHEETAPTGVWNTTSVAQRTRDAGNIALAANLSSSPLLVASLEQLSTNGNNALKVDNPVALCKREVQLADNPQAQAKAVKQLQDRIVDSQVKKGTAWYFHAELDKSKSNTCSSLNTEVPVKKNLGDYLAVTFDNGDSVALDFDKGMTPVVGMYQDQQVKYDPELRKQIEAKRAQEQVNTQRKQVVDKAMEKLDKTIYVWGGKDFAGNKVDCSGLTGGAFGAAGIKGVPMSTASQDDYGIAVKPTDAKPADLVVYDSPASPSGGHSALYIGDGKVIENPGTGMKVRISPLEKKGMKIRTIRRVIKDVPDAPAAATQEAPKQEAPKKVVKDTAKKPTVQAASTTASKATVTPPSTKARPTQLAVPGLSSKQLKDWENVASCESSFRWTVVANHGKYGTHYGGLQFNPATWNTYKKGISTASTADKATVEEQILVAEATLKGQGWKAWECAKRYGLSGKSH